MANNPTFFGLNLGHNSFKIAEVKYEGARARLQVLSSQPTSVGVLDNESEAGLKKLSEEILLFYMAIGVLKVLRKETYPLRANLCYPWPYTPFRCKEEHRSSNN